MEALRAVLSPVKRENSFYRDGDDDTTTATNLLHNSVQTSSHLPPAITSAPAVVDKLSGTASGTSSADKLHGQQCVYCTLSFKSKGELERHVKSTHVIPTTSQKCNICDEVFPSAAVLAEHKLTHCKVGYTHSD